MQAFGKGEMDRHGRVRQANRESAIVVGLQLRQLNLKIRGEKIGTGDRRLIMANRIAEPIGPRRGPRQAGFDLN